MEAAADFSTYATPWLTPRLEGAPRRRRGVSLGDIVVVGDDRAFCGFGTISGGAWSAPSYGLCLQALSATVGAQSYGAQSFVVGALDDPVIVVYLSAPVAEPLAVSLSKSKHPKSEAASVAAEVREISGLSARKLGAIFPVQRESFQRWLNGEQTPSEANLERLLTLRHFLRALAQRVPDPTSWLLSPLHDGRATASAYDVLRSGNLTDLWAAISALPSTAPRRTYVSEEGGFATVVEGSLRGRDYSATAEELDDYAELFDDDE